MSVYNQYPNVFHTIGFYLECEKRNVDNYIRRYIMLELPNVLPGRKELGLNINDFLKKQSPMAYEDICTTAFKIKAMEDENQKFKNRLRCTIYSFTTYNQLKNEFPEAYNILLELDAKWEAEENNKLKPTHTPCDTVEALRAELNSK